MYLNKHNGHDSAVLQRFNDLAKDWSEGAVLDIVLNRFCNDDEITEITELMIESLPSEQRPSPPIPPISMKTVFRIIERESHDMNIFITEKNGVVTGLNYHFGIGAIDESFYTPDPVLTALYNTRTNIKSIEERIYAAVDERHRWSIEDRDKPVLIEIPDAQLAIIRKALLYYRDCILKFTDVATETQEYELFDLKQLDAMLHYKVSVELTGSEKEKFTSKHGIDTPLYK